MTVLSVTLFAWLTTLFGSLLNRFRPVSHRERARVGDPVGANGADVMVSDRSVRGDGDPKGGSLRWNARSLGDRTRECTPSRSVPLRVTSTDSPTWQPSLERLLSLA